MDLRKFSNGLFSETEKGFGVGPTPGGSQCTGVSSTLSPPSTLSLKETTLSGSKWCLEMSGRASNQDPVHDIQLGRRKSDVPEKLTAGQ